MNAILYLDNLDMVTFDSELEYKLARSLANKLTRPYLALGRRNRQGRKVWCVFDTHYFDPTLKRKLVAHSLS